MEAFVISLTTGITTIIDIFTVLLIGFGVFEATVKIINIIFFRRQQLEMAKEEIRLMLGKWLALSLEFTLAADILRSIIAPTWDEIGKLAAIIVLRTVLNYFLEKEFEQAMKKKEL